MSDALFELVFIGVGVDLESILNYHTVVAIKLRPLAVLWVLIEPGPV